MLYRSKLKIDQQEQIEKAYISRLTIRAAENMISINKKTALLWFKKFQLTDKVYKAKPVLFGDVKIDEKYVTILF